MRNHSIEKLINFKLIKNGKNKYFKKNVKYEKSNKKEIYFNNYINSLRY